MPRIAPIKSAAEAASRYGTNGSAASATEMWAKNFTADIPAILSAAANAIPRWQAAVASAAAATAMGNGLNRAKNRVAQIAAKVNGVGKASLAAGVRAAATSAYLEFSTAWQAAVGSQVAQLDRTNPRGDRGANRARQAAYDAWVDSQAGKFRVR